MSKVYLSELYFYLSRTIGHRFWRTLLVNAVCTFILVDGQQNCHILLNVLRLAPTSKNDDDYINYSFRSLLIL